VVSEITLQRRAFWACFAERLPELAARMARGNETSRWLAVGPFPLIAAHYVGAGAVGIFVRGARGTRIGHVREMLFPRREFITLHLGPNVKLGTQFLLESRLRLPMNDRKNWPRAADWLAERSPRYEALLAAVQAT
jgi:hypothetical protein